MNHFSGRLKDLENHSVTFELNSFPKIVCKQQLCLFVLIRVFMQMMRAKLIKDLSSFVLH